MGEARGPDDAPILVSCGFTHRRADAALRERLFRETEIPPRAIALLKAAGFTDCLPLVTCDRAEIFAAVADSAEASERLVQLWAELAEMPVAALAPTIERHEGRGALAHLTMIAAALDSATVGEAEILGQVKAAHRQAEAGGLIGPWLSPILQNAYRVAKRVRRETPIGQEQVSIAAAARRVARELHGDLSRARLLLLGAGEAGEAVAHGFAKIEGTSISLAHPQAALAEALAGELGGAIVAWADLPAALADADIVVAALGRGQPLVTAPTVRAALKVRRQRPILLFDLALPAEIDRAIDALDNAFRYDLDDLEQLVMHGQGKRERALAAAFEILHQEIALIEQALGERAAAPLLVALRSHFEGERRAALAESGGDAEAATRRLINRLLHRPSAALRELAGEGHSPATEKLLRRLFGLQDGAEK